MKKNISKMALLLCAATFSLASCMDSGDDTIVIENGSVNNTGIPSDELATQNPEIESSTTTISNPQYVVETDGDNAILKITMTGVQDPSTLEWLRLIGTAQSGQNVWVSVDGKPKGISVYNNADKDADNKMTVDMVFVVDNSGSMSEEANGIAHDITEWTRKLNASNLDIRFGCIGYGGHVGAQYSYLVKEYGVTGALDLTTDEELNEYLNGRGKTGVMRTFGYYGKYADVLSTVASSKYDQAGGECGMQALRMADENFHFRSEANRIYVNFTDDANYPATDKNISIKHNIENGLWTVDKGTVHSVISNDTTRIKNISIGEAPWLLSKYTGGTIIVAPSSFSGVTLESLPVTGAMQNSYIIKFTNIEEFMDGKQHTVKITILSADGNTRAEKTFYVIFGNK